MTRSRIAKTLTNLLKHTVAVKKPDSYDAASFLILLCIGTYLISKGQRTLDLKSHMYIHQRNCLRGYQLVFVRDIIH